MNYRKSLETSGVNPYKRFRYLGFVINEDIVNMKKKFYVHIVK